MSYHLSPEQWGQVLHRRRGGPASESGGKRRLMMRVRRFRPRDRVAVAVLPQLDVVLGSGPHHRSRVRSKMAHTRVQPSVVLQHSHMLLLLLLEKLLLGEMLLLRMLVPGVHERGLAQVDHALLSRRQSSRRGKSGKTGTRSVSRFYKQFYKFFARCGVLSHFLGELNAK